MAPLAGMLSERGYRVTGSDAGVYPPASTLLESLGIKWSNGFSEENLSRAPDVVVLGNALSRGNPEVECVLERKIPYRSLPQVIEAQVGHDSVDPGIEGTLKAEAANVYISTQKGFLVDVLSIFLRAGEMNCEAQHGTVVLPYQFFESGCVAELSSADELCVIYANWTNLLSMLNSDL